MLRPIVTVLLFLKMKVILIKSFKRVGMIRMLKQHIDPLKFLLAMHKLQENQQEPTSRFSLLDAICLLYINEHKECGQADIVAFIAHDRSVSKSRLDKPLLRLFERELIEKKYNASACTILNEPRVSFSISKSGEAFLKRNKNGCN